MAVRGAGGSAQLVSASENTVSLSPLELDASTRRDITCPHGVPTTVTWKSQNEPEMRYPESIAIRLTRVQRSFPVSSRRGLAIRKAYAAAPPRPKPGCCGGSAYGRSEPWTTASTPSARTMASTERGP
jgi:hypothetical protein